MILPNNEICSVFVEFLRKQVRWKPYFQKAMHCNFIHEYQALLAAKPF
jgi:hypothetical protein